MTPELSAWTWGPAASLFFAYAFPVLTSGVSTVRSLRSGARARRQAHAVREAAESETLALDEGDLLLRGRVEEDGAVRAIVEQEGTEAERSGSWSVTWTERSRKIEVKPFSVRHASGERVRVEPGRDTKLAAPLGATERTSLSRRKRIAAVATGTDVWVTGILGRELDREAAGAYRGGKGWVMRPRRQEPMVIATQAPEAALSKRARAGATFGVYFAILFGVMLLAQGSYDALLLTGVPATAVVTEKSHRDGEPHLAVEVSGPRGARFKDGWDVTSASFDATQKGDSFPCIASVVSATSQPGAERRASGVSTFIPGVIWLILILVARVLSSRAWHEGETVIETESGRLADSFR
ncbi:MAG TPA: hypothetical protein VGH28_14250 [Polyangiaceae bacterium]